MNIIKYLSVYIIIALPVFVKAQNAVTGTVQDKNGNKLHYVFVESLNDLKAVYTDSVGQFVINVTNASSLIFKYPGVKDTTIKVTSAGITVILNVNGAQSTSLALNAKNTISTQPVNAALTGMDMSAISSGSAGTMPSMAHQKCNVHGNRYLFDIFVHGFIINAANQIIQNVNYLFDYDKISGALLLTDNNKSVTKVSDGEIKDFTLYGPDDFPHTFVRVPLVDKILYTEIIAVGNRYHIYKLTRTKFLKSDYVNTGVSSHGNDYDEYVDDDTYYVEDMQTKQLKKLSLKKKSLKEDFAGDTDKLNKFMSANNGNIDDAYLSKLGDYMNN